MRKEKISTSQAYLLITTFIMGTSLALTSYSDALQDTWISILIALVCGILMTIIYSNIMNRFPNMDLFQILEFVFGKVVGKIVGFLYAFYFLHLGAICARNITEYIQVVSFPETPQYFTGLFLGFLIIYILKSGLEVIARVNKFLLPLLLIGIFLTLLMAFPKLDISKFLPILYNGWSPVVSAAFLTFTFPFGETVIFMSILNTVDEKRKSMKIYLTGIFLGGMVLMFAVLRNIMILGFPNLAISDFPSYFAATLIDIGNYIRGMELVISIVIVVAGFIKVAVCLLGTSIGFSRIFNFADYKWISTSLGLLIISLSFILYDNTMHMFEWVDIYKYYALPFQVFLPIIILILGIFKKRKIQSPNTKA